MYIEKYPNLALNVLPKQQIFMKNEKRRRNWSTNITKDYITSQHSDISAIATK